ncbi:hypothetical protein [Flexistipes sinusarabici]|nr:hypothetical protein [Flexistipes sinusarabici]
MMPKPVKIIFLLTMTSALSFGFMHLFFPQINFERLHIFLFNLCSGGTIILYFSENFEHLSKRVWLFFILSICYALTAFFELYVFSIILALIMAFIVEKVRVDVFRFFPSDFFRMDVPTASKFHHASLLCLSIGLIFSAFAVLNHQYIHMLPFRKLTLNTFFLGFSFPVSLITLSVMFSMMHRARNLFKKRMKVLCFWTITLGVIIFFGFILFESLILELIISIILFIAVGTVLYLYVFLGIKEQRKSFLTSGIIFLLLTAVTGILYIALYFFLGSGSKEGEIVLNLHRIISLYGWNMSGLAVISRFHNFPIKLHSGYVIILHWIIVCIFIPIGYYNVSFAIISIAAFFIFLLLLFFSKGSEVMPSTRIEVVP